MSIFKHKKEFDKYKDKNNVLKSIRVDKATAVKIDELQAVCISVMETQVSQNQLLTGIVTAFINEVESIAQTDEEKAVSKVLAVID